MSEDGSKPKDDSSSLQNKISRIFGHGQEKLRNSVKDWDARKALDAVLDEPAVDPNATRQLAKLIEFMGCVDRVLDQ